jgi:hypothetical protein
MEKQLWNSMTPEERAAYYARQERLAEATRRRRQMEMERRNDPDGLTVDERRRKTERERAEEEAHRAAELAAAEEELRRQTHLARVEDEVRKVRGVVAVRAARLGLARMDAKIAELEREERERQCMDVEDALSLELDHEYLRALRHQAAVMDAAFSGFTPYFYESGAWLGRGCGTSASVVLCGSEFSGVLLVLLQTMWRCPASMCPTGTRLRWSAGCGPPTSSSAAAT